MSAILSRCRNLPEKSFESGEVLLAEGQKTGVMYILAEGEVEILKGDFQVNTVSEPGSFLGEVSALLDLPHMATVKALEPCRVYVASDPLAFLRSDPELTLVLSRLLAKRLNSVTTYLADLKRQFGDSSDHLGIVDEVLESLLHQQDEAIDPGSERYPDKSID